MAKAISSSDTSQKSKLVWEWYCPTCERSCIPIRSESRCLCGHRLKDHNSGQTESSFSCTRCSCAKFFYIVAEGSWILRCRCKHKHTDHDPKPPYKCKKSTCKQCTGFDSPWVCNCNCPWRDHVQKLMPMVSHGLGIEF